ncbi:MAG: GC-type dockerin domain-anchored protein [Phycisphaerales bacterium JB064]
MTLKTSAASLALLATAAAACAQTYDMALTDASGLDGSLLIGIDTTGSLIGDWDPDTNPTGTRTKPGLFGSFGATENVPVPASVGLAIGDDLMAGSSGGFSLVLDTAEGEATVSGAVFDLLGGGSLALPAEISLSFDSFRTRAPDSTFIGGFPITLPLGELSLTALHFTQTEAAIGMLTPTGPDAWSLAIALPGELTGEVDALGSPLELPPTPALLPLAGTVTLVGGELVFSAGASLEQDSTQEPMTALPPIPLPLPTILPAGSTANLVANLMLDELSVGFVADIVVEARGEAASCSVDCDGDGTLTVFDFLCFLSLFDMGDPAADCDGDGTLTLFDFLCFQSAFDRGCE